ncbi:L,D-transpeptidase [Bartonella sp. LJL80]
MRFKSVLIAAGLLAASALTGCTTTGGPSGMTSTYPSVNDGGYVIPAVPQDKIKPEYRRQIVNYPTSEKPGTIIIETQTKHLYFVMEDGKAMRYGIGVGRDGFRWSGNASVGRKAEWPVWTPPPAMMGRQPELRKFAGGMKPGLTNPLGARALYLYKNGRDSMYRLHGTPEWWTIGSNVSSGCVRLINQDIIDLYNRAAVGAKVIVR